jgi:hypothetical protein
MPTRKTTRKRGGTFAALGQAASNLLVPLGLFYAARQQRSRVARSRKHRKHRNTLRTSY